MQSPFFTSLLTYAIAAVWLLNGLWCKVLGLVPRHQQIVATILGADHAATLTMLIGISEILMAVWILSRIKPRLCAIIQIIIVATMNTIEFITVPHLLLFGRANALVAVFFILVVAFHEFVLRPQSTRSPAPVNH